MANCFLKSRHKAYWRFTLLVWVNAATSVSAATLVVESAPIERDIERFDQPALNGNFSSLALRFGGGPASGLPFIQRLQLEYSIDSSAPEGSSGNSVVEQFAATTYFTKGDAASGYTTLGLGVTGIRYDVEEFLSTHYFGARLTAGGLAPILDSNLSFRGTADLDYLFEYADGELNQEEVGIVGIGAKLGINYSFKIVQVGVSYFYRIYSVSGGADEPRTQDVTSGPLARIRVAF